MKAARSFPTLPAVALAAALSGCSSAPLPSAQSPALGKSIQLSLPSDGGESVSVPVQGAKATVLEFWSPSCAPCRERVPAIVGKVSDIQSRGGKLILIGVLSEDESAVDARGALEAWGIRFPFLVDQDGAVAQKQAEIEELPATLILNASGKVHWVAPTEASAADVVRAMP